MKTLHMLEEEITKSDFVVHIIGAEAGWNPPVDQVEAFLERHKDFVTRFSGVAAAARAGQVSATQWEAWLALFFGKRLYGYEFSGRLVAGAPQKVHSERLHDAHEHPKAVCDDDAACLRRLLVRSLSAACFPKSRPNASLPRRGSPSIRPGSSSVATIGSMRLMRRGPTRS